VRCFAPALVPTLTECAVVRQFVAPLPPGWITIAVDQASGIHSRVGRHYSAILARDGVLLVVGYATGAAQNFGF
jgi:hypothetical protein